MCLADYPDEVSRDTLQLAGTFSHLYLNERTGIGLTNDGNFEHYQKALVY